MVISVALVLTGLLLPALAQVRENAYRVVCSSNQRQVGMGLFMYVSDYDEQLPRSSWLDQADRQPQELMMAFRDEALPDPETGELVEVGWDGIGLIFHGGYCDAPDCYYCPSHEGEHTLERYQPQWDRFIKVPDGHVYTNYHYSGHKAWQGDIRRRLEEGERITLLTDGLRTQRDFNHGVGLNVLRGDGAVLWREDHIDIFESLPPTALSQGGGAHQTDEYQRLWSDIESSLK